MATYILFGDYLEDCKVSILFIKLNIRLPIMSILSGDGVGFVVYSSLSNYMIELVSASIVLVVSLISFH